MRRFWANVLIAGASLLTVFAATPSVINKINTNGDYKTQRQFTFQLSQIEQVGDNDAGKEIQESSAQDMAKVMESRLIASKISSYQITTSGNDLVTVTFSADSEERYGQITTYLSFSGSFALVNTQDDLVVGEAFLDGNAYLKAATVNEYPTVIIPVKTSSSEYESLITHARENPEQGEASEEGGEAEETATITMLYNYVEGDTYKTLTEQNKLSEKTFLTFNAISDETLYLNGKNENGKAAYAQTCGFSDTNGNGVADPNEVKAAYDQADYLLNLLNSKALDYNVKLIKGDTEDTKVWVAPKVESIKDFNSITFNATLISIVVAIVVVSLLLVVFYRLGALNVMTSTLLSSFLTFLFVTLIGLEYNTLSIVAYLIVAITALVSGIIYCAKLKEEAYRGRTLKKANAEASKKSLLPVVDVHIVTLVVGLMIFLMGGTALHSFASIITLGSLVSLVISTLGLKGLMWLSTNATALTGKYEVFGINSENVPNHMAEEKQRYFGPYADKDFTKRKKSVSIASAAVFAAALIGIIVSSSLNAGNLFRQPAAKANGSEIYVTSKIEKIDDSSKTDLSSNPIEELFKDILVYEKNEARPTAFDTSDSHILYNKIKTNMEEVKGFEVSESKYENEKSVVYVTTYFTYNLNNFLDGDQYYADLISTPTGEAQTLNQLLAGEAVEKLESLVTDKEEFVISLKTVQNVPASPTPDWQKMSLSVFVAILILTLYFMLRYRLSRGLAMLIYPFVGSAITLGFFTLISACGLSLPASIVVSMPIIVLLTYVFMILFANKERDILSDDKVKDNTLEHRIDVSKRAMGIAFTPILAVLAIGIYLLINFFGFAPSVNSFAYLAAIIGVLVAVGVVAVTFAPLSNLLFKWFSRVNIERKPRKSKKNIQVVKKSAEPEEAIFIGIND